MQGLVDAGVRDAVVCPGSRSQALALVLAEAERDGLIRVHVRFDERSAGFLALGLARGSGVPVPVVVTSGSAVANLWPAVIEAHHDGVALLVVTADRPAELIGIGANQTTRQPGIFGFAVRSTLSVEAPSAESVDADARIGGDVARLAFATACGPIPGPVHVNMAYRDPLSGAHPPLRRPSASVASQQPNPEDGSGRNGRDQILPEQPSRLWAQRDVFTDQTDCDGAGVEACASGDDVVTVAVAEGTIVVAGSGAGAEAADAAEYAGLPLIAEIVSGARRGPTVVPHYRAALRSSLVEQVTRVVVFGRPTLSREVSALLARPGLDLIVVDQHRPEPFAPQPDAVAATAVRFEGIAPAGWLTAWLSEPPAATSVPTTTSTPPLAPPASSLTAPVVPDDQGADVRAMVALAVARATGPHDTIYLAASSMVRVVDEWAPAGLTSIFANRGVAGIDGTVSTAVGVSLTQPGLTRALVGDLAFLHDVGGLFVPDAEPFPPVQFVVVNDGGGSIFRGLEVARADPDLFLRVVETPHAVDLDALARSYGWPFVRVDDVAELPRILADFGPGIIEIPVA